MNTRVTLWSAMVALLLATAGACTKDALTKDLSVKLLTTVEMNVAGGDPLAGVWGQELDPMANADVKDNLDKIKDVTVERLTYRVEDYLGGGGTTGSGTWKFFPVGSTSEVYTLGTLTDVNLQDLKGGAEQDLTLDDKSRKKLVELVKAGKKVMFVFDGAVTEKPAWSRFGLRIYTKIKVGV